MNGRKVIQGVKAVHLQKLLPRQSGGVLLELVFLVPLLLLIIAGLTEMGMVIGQATWVSESAYQTTLVGGENQKFLGNRNMEDKYNKFYALQGARFKNNIPSLTPTYDLNNRTVKFETSGQLKPLFMSDGLANWLNANFDLNLGIYYVGPHMAQSPGAVLNGLTIFGNNSAGKYCGCDQACNSGVPNLLPCPGLLGVGLPAPQEVGGEPNPNGGGGGGGGDDAVDWQLIKPILERKIP